MMMVRMLVRLLSLLAGRPLLSRRRAAVLGEGGNRRHQDDASETHTKKCANHAALRCHIRPLLPTGQMGSQVLGGSIGRHPCDETPVSRRLRPIKEFKERAGVEHIDPPAQELLVSEVPRDANSGGDAYFFGIDRGVTADGKS
jgi:hypothetical protein